MGQFLTLKWPKMTGVISYEFLEIDLQAQASGLSLLAPDKGPRTEN